jgi:hypothetical protein
LRGLEPAKLEVELGELIRYGKTSPLVEVKKPVLLMPSSIGEFAQRDVTVDISNKKPPVSLTQLEEKYSSPSLNMEATN